jgi:hypothetical protein
MDCAAVHVMLLAAVVALIVVAGRLGGAAHSASVAFAGAFSFDSFHVEPIRVLRLRTLAVLLVSFAWPRRVGDTSGGALE